MRIASLLPSATEIAFAIGAGDDVVAVSHECDYPPAVQALPAVTAPAVPTAGLRPAEIDTAIADLLRAGGSTYTIDVPLLRALQPDLLLTQALCDVCAVSEGQVHRTVHEQELGASVLTLSPLDLDGVFTSIEAVITHHQVADPFVACTADYPVVETTARWVPISSRAWHTPFA